MLFYSSLLHTATIVGLLTSWLNSPIVIALRSGVNVDGEATTAQEDARAVQFFNAYRNQTISLFWDGSASGSDSVHMFDIDAQTTADVNTFLDHVFFATPADDRTTRVQPFQLVITETKDVYTFGVPESARTGEFKVLNPKVKYINQRTTSISTKFRCLARKVDMWYEDGRGGNVASSSTKPTMTTHASTKLVAIRL